MKKTEFLILKRQRQRKIITTVAISAATIALTFGLFSLQGFSQVEDVVISNPSTTNFEAASENAPISTPMLDESEITSDILSPEPWEDWSLTKTINNIEINVTSNIQDSYTEYSSLKLYKTEPVKIDLSLAEKAVKYFLGDTYYEYGLTQNDYSLKIIAAQNLYNSLNLNDSQRKQAQYYINHLKDEQIDAIESLSRGSIDFSLKSSKDDYYEYLVLRGSSSNSIELLEVINTNTPLQNFISYSRGDIGRQYVASIPITSKLDFPDKEVTAINQALSIANDAVKYFADEMVCNFALEGYVYDDSLDINDLESLTEYSTAEKCYIFYYTKSYEYLSLTYSDFITPYAKDIAITPTEPNPWDNGYIKVIVDDSGIAKFLIYNVNDKVEVIEENIQIISYKESEEIYKEQIFNKNYNSTYGNVYDINISKVTLEMVKVELDDGTFNLIPAYTFKGSETSTTSDGMVYTHGNILNNTNILIINAINGSIIE